jgi:DNA-binding PadR family transcriptional regulator
MKNQNKVQYPILGFLIQYPMSGYALKKQMDVSVANFMSPSFGNIYPTLNRLKEAGMIEAITQKGARKKVIYHATEKGKSHFLTWMREKPEDPFLAQVYFMNLISKEERIHLLETHIQTLNMTLHHLLQIEDEYQSVMGHYAHQTLTYGTYIYTQEIAFYQDMLEGEKA